MAQPNYDDIFGTKKPENQTNYDDIFGASTQQQPQEAPKPDFLSSYVGSLENLLSTATGGIGSLAGGIAGAVSAPFIGGADAGGVVNTVQEALTYQPRTQGGKQIQQNLAKMLKPVVDYTSAKPGNFFFDLAQSPTFKGAAALSPAMGILADNPALAGALGASAIPAALELAGLKGAKTIKTAADARKLIAEEIKNGNPNIDNIIHTLDADGNLIKNPNVRRAAQIIADEDRGKHAAITFERMSKPDRIKFNKMLDTVVEQRRRGTEWAMENRPTNVVGESITDRVKEAQKIRKEAGAGIQKALDDLGDTTIDIKYPVDDFMTKMQEAGVQFDVDDTGRIVSNFDNAMLNLGEVLPKGRFDDLVNMMQTGSMSAKSAHQFKQFIREFVDYDTSGALQAPGAKQSKIVADAIKQLSSDVGNEIGKASDLYAQSNAKFATVADALSKASKKLGKFDLDSDLTTAKAGQLSRRIGSELATKEEIIDMINSLDESLAKNGIKFKDDIRSQVASLSILDDVFNTSKTQAPFGFRSSITSAIEAANSPANLQSQMGALDVITNALRRMKEKDFEQRVKILRKMSEVK